MVNVSKSMGYTYYYTIVISKGLLCGYSFAFLFRTLVPCLNKNGLDFEFLATFKCLQFYT